MLSRDKIVVKYIVMKVTDMYLYSKTKLNFNHCYLSFISRIWAGIDIRCGTYEWVKSLAAGTYRVVGTCNGDSSVPRPRIDLG